MTENDDVGGIDGLLPFASAMADHAGICRVTAYEFLKSGKIQAVKIGRNTMVRRSELARFLAALPAYQPTQRRAAA